MKIRFAQGFVLLACVIYTGCRNSEEGADPKPERKPFIFTAVDGDHSDIDLDPTYGFDTHVYGSFQFDENYFYHPDKGYDFQSNWYRAWYEGNGIGNSRINRSLMCATRCDSSDYLVRNGYWQRYDVSGSSRTVVWEFVSLNSHNGYRITMKELPEKLRATNIPTFLSTVGDNVLSFSTPPTSDSILFELIVVPKENIERKNATSLISIQHHFSVRAVANQIIIPGELIKRVAITSTDTVFMNLVSLKRVVKIIEADKMALTYRVNNLYPVKVR